MKASFFARATMLRKAIIFLGSSVSGSERTINLVSGNS